LSARRLVCPACLGISRSVKNANANASCKAHAKTQVVENASLTKKCPRKHLPLCGTKVPQMCKRFPKFVSTSTISLVRSVLSLPARAPARTRTLCATQCAHLTTLSRKPLTPSRAPHHLTRDPRTHTRACGEFSILVHAKISWGYLAKRKLLMRCHLTGGIT
jgi:hypothetical protein